MQVKAKAIRKYVDKMITLAKRGDLHARRQVSTRCSLSQRIDNLSLRLESSLFIMVLLKCKRLGFVLFCLDKSIPVQ